MCLRTQKRRTREPAASNDSDAGAANHFLGEDGQLESLIVNWSAGEVERYLPLPSKDKGMVRVST